MPQPEYQERSRKVWLWGQWKTQCDSDILSLKTYIYFRFAWKNHSVFLQQMLSVSVPPQPSGIPLPFSLHPSPSLYVLLLLRIGTCGCLCRIVLGSWMQLVPIPESSSCLAACLHHLPLPRGNSPLTTNDGDYQSRWSPLPHSPLQSSPAESG